jgi:hypothetical protein
LAAIVELLPERPEGPQRDPANRGTSRALAVALVLLGLALMPVALGAAFLGLIASGNEVAAPAVNALLAAVGVASLGLTGTGTVLAARAVRSPGARPALACLLGAAALLGGFFGGTELFA